MLLSHSRKTIVDKFAGLIPLLPAFNTGKLSTIPLRLWPQDRSGMKKCKNNWRKQFHKATACGAKESGKADRKTPSQAREFIPSYKNTGNTINTVNTGNIDNLNNHGGTVLLILIRAKYPYIHLAGPFCISCLMALISF